MTHGTQKSKSGTLRADVQMMCFGLCPFAGQLSHVALFAGRLSPVIAKMMISSQLLKLRHKTDFSFKTSSRGVHFLLNNSCSFETRPGLYASHGCGQFSKGKQRFCYQRRDEIGAGKNQQNNLITMPFG